MIKRKVLSFVIISIISLFLWGCSQKTAPAGNLVNPVIVVEVGDQSAREVHVSSNFKLPIKIANKGKDLIPAGESPSGINVFASFHWYKITGERFVWDSLRTPLPSDIKPDDYIKMKLNILAPSTPGEYDLVVDLVQEKVLWFESSPASKPLKIRYKVLI